MSEQKLTAEIVESYIGKEISDLARDWFGHVRYARRNTTAARTVRDLGFSVGRNGRIYQGRPVRPDFEEMTDRTGKPYAKLSGLKGRGAKRGLTALFFPSKFKKNFMMSLRTWGQSSFNIDVKPKDIEVTPSGVRVHVKYIEIVPDRKYLPKFMKWVKSIKLPYKKEEDDEDEN